MIIDSNILIYAVSPDYDSLRAYLARHKLYTSLITKLEVMGYHRLKPVDRKALEQLVLSTSILLITDEVVTEAIRLRQQRKRSLGDSIIAATAVLHKLPVMTNNTADFEDINGLEIISMASVL